MSIAMPRRELWTPPRANISVHNEFVAELRDAKTGKLKQRAFAYNAVLNNFRKALADQWGLIQDHMNQIYVGTGTSAPNAAQVGLEAPKAYAHRVTPGSVPNSTTTGSDPANGVWFRRHKYQFSETVANYSLTEVGLNQKYGLSGYSTGLSQNETTQENSQFGYGRTRALFKDANGNPIAINKSPTEVLTVTATVYLQRGGVDTGMALLNTFFEKQKDVTVYDYDVWMLGVGNVAPANGDVALSGSLFSQKGGGYYKNEWFWDAAISSWFRRNTLVGGVQARNPSGMDYISTRSCDWNLLEAVGTFSEVLVRGTTGSNTSSEVDSSRSIVRVAFPCGTVAGTSYTKTNQVKLRQYFEVNWGG